MTTPVSNNSSNTQTLYTKFEDWVNKNQALVDQGNAIQKQINEEQSIYESNLNEAKNKTYSSKEEEQQAFQELDSAYKHNRNMQIQLEIQQVFGEKELGREFDILDGKDASEYDAQLEEFTQGSVDAYDENKDGKISLDEYISHETENIDDFSDDELKQLEEVYNFIDEDSNGIDTNEMLAFWEMQDEATDGKKDGKITLESIVDEPSIDVEVDSIEIDSWDSNNENNIDCASRLVENTFGVSFYSDEGQEIYKYLQELNPDIDFDNLEAGAKIKLADV